MKTTIYHLLVFSFLPLLCFSRQREKSSVSLRGSVFSGETLLPLKGATVHVKGSNISAISDSDGQFFISLPSGEGTLLISYIGYQNKEISVDSLTGAKSRIYLSIAEASLKEVVISTGYQQIAKQKVTGSYERIGTELFSRTVSTDVLSRLEGIVTGLNVDKRTGNNSISIRGLSTIYASTQPLVVLNDFPYDGDINNINPNDIESISILKDASAASIWGARAGNGVIVISTKKGRFSQKPLIDVNSNISIAEKPDIFALPRISSSDFIDAEMDLFNKGFYTSMESSYDHPVLSPVVELLIKQRDGLISEADATRQINALKEMDVRNDFHKYWYKPSLNQQYSFNIKGGEENIRYYFSAGYDNNTSSLSNKYDRFTLSSSNSFYPLKGLEITAGLNYTLANNRYGRGDYTSVSSGTGVSLYPYAQLADEYGNPTAVLKDYRQVFKEESEQKGFLNWDYYPLQESNLTDNTSKLNDALFNTGLKYQFLKGLSVNLKYQYEQSSNEGRVLYNKNSYYTRNLINQYTQQTEAGEITRPIPEGDILNLSDGKTVSHSFRAQLDFNKDWNKHSLSAIAGYELKDLKNIQHTSNRYGYSDDVLTSIPVDYSGFYALSNYSYYLSATIPDNVSYMDRLTRFVSFFSNAAYTYDRRYTLSASARKDGSNLFGVNTNQKAVPLYSAGVAWEVSNERFYNFSLVPYLKLRTTYGYNGNLDNSLSAFTTIAFYSGANLTNGQYASVRNPPNPNLIWEKTGIFNLGIDFALGKNIIYGSFDYYHKTGRNLIGYGQIDPTSGYKNPTNPAFPNSFKGNVAGMRGNGVDITLHTNNLNKSFKWSTDIQASWSVNKISKYLIESDQGSLFINSGLGIAPLEGKPVYSVLSYKWRGLSHENGDPQGILNGELSTDYSAIINSTTVNDLIYSGPALPPYFGAFRNTFSFKEFSLSANILYKFGHYFRRSSISYSALYNSWNGHSDYAIRWQKQGDELTTSVPSSAYPVNSNRDEFYMNSEVLVDRADHIRLKDVSLSYTVNRKIYRRLPVQSVQFYTYADNLFILWRANKDGIDPEYGTGIPPSKTISFGLRASF